MRPNPDSQTLPADRRRRLVAEILARGVRRYFSLRSESPHLSARRSSENPEKQGPSALACGADKSATVEAG
jgi:hypothetical protein